MNAEVGILGASARIIVMDEVDVYLDLTDLVTQTSVTLEIDTSSFVDQCQKIGDALKQLAQAFVKFGECLRECAGTSVERNLYRSHIQQLLDDRQINRAAWIRCPRIIPTVTPRYQPPLRRQGRARSVLR